MMSIFSLVLFLYFYFLLMSSVHLLILLIMVELLVLFNFVFMLIHGISFMVGLFFLLVAVCMGAYSICLYLSFSRSKGMAYMLSKVGGGF